MDFLSFRRRQFFIKKDFQGKFIAIYTIGVIAMAGITTLILNNWLHKIVDEQLYSSHMKVHRTGELFLSPLIQTNLYAMLAVSLLVLVFSIIVFKRLNRHFCGMDEAFNAMAKGDYQSYDPPPSRFEEINSMVDLVRKAQDDYAVITGNLSTLTQEVRSEVESGVSPLKIQELRERLSTILKKVQLPESI